MMVHYLLLARYISWNSDFYMIGQMNDARLNVSIALTAAAHGANVVNHTEVLRLSKKPNPHKATSPSHSTSSHTQHIATSAGVPVLLPTEPAPLPAETATDEGIASPSENTIIPTSTPSTPSYPSYAQPPLPPPTPSPPPSAPVNPVEKAIESLKSFITGSGKNLETGASHLKADSVISGAVVRDNILNIFYNLESRSFPFFDIM